MSWTAVRNAAVAIVGTVEGTGPVYDRLRYTVDPTKFRTLFLDADADRIRSVQVTRRGATSRRLSHGRNEVGHELRIVVIEGVNDAGDSETTWRARVEAIRQALDLSEEHDAGPFNGSALRQEPADVPVEEFRLVGDVFCHYAEIGVRVFAAEEVIA